MKTIKARGLVIKEYETGEADKRLLLLCKGIGKVLVYARGARKPRSKFLSAAQIFTYSDFILAQGRGFYSVAQADVIENFYNLRTDYDRLCAAHAVTEVLEKTLWENADCDEILLLTLKTLSYLSKGKFSPLQITCVFFLRFFDAYGLRPHSEECAVCGLSSVSMEDKFFWGSEGLICASHAPRDSLKISAAAVAAVSHILNNGLSQSFHFTACESVLNELASASKILLYSHMD